MRLPSYWRDECHCTNKSEQPTGCFSPSMLVPGMAHCPHNQVSRVNHCSFFLNDFETMRAGVGSSVNTGSYADLALRINVSAMLDGWTQGAQAQHQESGDQAGASSFCGVFLVLVTCSHALCSHKLVAWSGSPPYPSCCPRSFQCVSLLSFDGKGVMGWAGLSS